MKLIDNTDLPAQLAFLARVNADPGKWLCFTLDATGAQDDNIVARGFDIGKNLSGFDGAALVEPPDTLRIFIPSGESARLQELLDARGWALTVMEPAPAQIAALSSQLEKSGSRRDMRSTLFMHRSGRTSNVIMVADDDALMCAAMKGGLERYGRCVFAHEAADIVQTYIRHSPDCVFLDLHLGNNNGLDYITAIIDYDRDAHIVMLTADSTASHAVTAKSRGAKSFVAKPMVMSRVEYELFRSPTFRRFAG